MTPSKTTAHLVRLLKERDAKGRKKYGTTLDRNDLTFEEWCEHAIEELLDCAGYLVRASQVREALSHDTRAAYHNGYADGYDSAQRRFSKTNKKK